MEPVTESLVRYCADADILILPFSAVAHGWFDKLARDGVTVDENGRFHSTASYKPEWMTAENARNDRILRSLHEKTGYSMTALSAAYLAGKRQPVIPIVSVSRPEQLAEYTAAMAIDLTGAGLGTWQVG